MPKINQRKVGTTDGETIEPSSGNVFADIGLENPEELLAKAELVHQISEMLKERKLTQKAAAALLGIDQPRISALIRGKLDSFSLDTLFRFLNALGTDVQIVVKPATLASGASTRVVSG